MVFLSQKVDGNMIFTDYWKVLVLIFSKMGNIVFSWAKNLTERWYLLIAGKFLLWTFRFLIFSETGNTVFSWAKKMMKIWYLLITRKFLFWPFRWWEIQSFFESRSWLKNDIFTGYWEVLLLNFSMMGKAVFFSAKNLIERWYLHGLFELSMIFQDLGNMVFCVAKD